MSNLRAEKRVNKLGVAVTKHVRDHAAPAASQARLAGAKPSLAKAANTHRTHFSEFDPSAKPREGYVPPSSVTTHSGMSRSTVGSKYRGYRDITDIKKDVEADIKEAVDAGYLPDGIKIRLKTARAARVQSLNARVEGLPDSLIYTGEKNNWGGPVYSELASTVVERLSNIVDAYDSSYSDMQSDGGGNVYYSGVGIVDEEQAEYALQQAAAKRRQRELKIEQELS